MMKKLSGVSQMFKHHRGLLAVLIALLCFIPAVNATIDFQDNFDEFEYGFVLTTGTSAQVGTWVYVDPGAFTYVTEVDGHSKALAVGRQETGQVIITSNFTSMYPTCDKRMTVEYDFYNLPTQFKSYYGLPVVFGNVGAGTDTFGLFWNAADGANAKYQYYTGNIAVRTASSVPVVTGQWVHVKMTLAFEASGVVGTQDILLTFADNTSAYVCQNVPITLQYPDGDLPRLYVFVGSAAAPSYNSVCIDNLVVDVINYPPTKAPLFSPGLPYIAGPTPVTITSDTQGANIYYNINSTSDPTTSSTPYNGPVTVHDGDVLKAIAVADGHRPSAVTSQTYEYNLAGATLSRGHNLLIERGLQIAALVFPVKEDDLESQLNPTGLNVSQFLSANFTTANLWSNCVGTPYLGTAPGIPWSRITHDGIVYEAEMPYLSNLVNFHVEDEQDLMDPNNLSEATAEIDYIKKHYPYVLAHTNQWGTQHTFAEMKTYMATAQPDLVMFDQYVFDGTLIGGSPKALYESMQKYRLLGLAGNDGTGAKPIPYAIVTQTFTYPTLNNHVISESEIRLNNFAAWAFGYKFATAFTYDSFDSYRTNAPIMFEGIDDSSPTPKFAEVAETNRQSKNLGPALVRLISTDVRMIMGLHGSGSVNDIPSGITTGITVNEANPYITAVSASNLGSTNNGLRGDVIIGFFKPLHETFDGNAYSNQKYFMVTNGLSDANGSASETRQQITLTFNMGTSNITSLQRLSRYTGEVEIVPLVSDGGGMYHLDLVLDGGTGDLFKYNTGAPFVGFCTPENPILGDANADGKVNVVDLGILATNYGLSGKTWIEGDFNGDGIVNVVDLGILATHFGEGGAVAADAKTVTLDVSETSAKNDAEVLTGIACPAAGLPLIAGLLLAVLAMTVKMDE